jgi:hypothetical protein
MLPSYVEPQRKSLSYVEPQRKSLCCVCHTLLHGLETKIPEI